jgi:hypothetical protein
MGGKIVEIWNIIFLKKYLHKNISLNQASKVSEHTLAYSKYLITLSSSAVALTFILLQIKSNINNFEVIKVSWCFFTLTILIGLIVHILEILKTFFEANSDRLKDSVNNSEPGREIQMYDNILAALAMARYSYIALILQTASFFVGVSILAYFLMFSF